MRKNKTQETKEKPMKIMLWGPSGAGKDYLIQGFIKECKNLNKENKNSNKYVFEVLNHDHQDTPAHQETEKPALTSRAEYTELVFCRQYGQDDKESNPYYFTHYHKVVILNNLGGNLVSFPVEDPTIIAAFRAAENFIVVMDQPSDLAGKVAEMRDTGNQDLKELIDSISPDNHSETNDINLSGEGRDDRSREAYNRNLELFFAHLDKFNTGKKRLIAICLTQADRHKLRGEPEIILSGLFGKDCLELINRYKKRYSIKIFVTTTEGFNESKVNPENPNFVDPTNTASPFFWFFEEAEKARLSKNFPEWLFGKERIKNYVPYPAPKS